MVGGGATVGVYGVEGVGVGGMGLGLEGCNLMLVLMLMLMLTLVVVAVTNLISNPYKQIDDQSLLWETNPCFHHGTHKIKEVEEKTTKQNK